MEFLFFTLYYTDFFLLSTFLTEKLYKIEFITKHIINGVLVNYLLACPM